MNDDSDAKAFYGARDVRTVQYGADIAALSRPVGVLVPIEVARTRAGQVAAFALVEMLLRVHRNVRIDAPDVSVVCPGRSGNLRTALAETAAAIDPFQDVSRPQAADEIIIVVGDEPLVGERLSLHWRGGRGEIRVDGGVPAGPDNISEVEDADAHLLGAATAATLAAAALFRLAHGATPRAAAVNVLERTADEHAGVTSALGPIEVGDTVVIGAGAVAHGLGYWVRTFGHTGAWTIVDRDVSALHNSSRCLGMTAADAGWPLGRPTGRARNKVDSVADLIGAATVPSWWHERPYDVGTRPDLLVVLANEQGVRTDVATLGLPLMLQATTSPDWTAELHRHIAGHDDCPGCRIPERPGQLSCAIGASSPGAGESSDAALPFLSAGAGLLLAAALLDLNEAGQVVAGRVNHWRLHLELGARLWQRLPHPGGTCPHELPMAVRKRLQAKAVRRWDHLDTT